MSDRFVFIPFDLGNVSDEEYGLNSDEVKKFSKNKFEVFYKDTTGKPLAGKTSPDVTIYIAGHGVAGDRNLSPTPEWKNMASSKEIVDDLIAKGLEKKFEGRIKCYNCHSAESEPAEPSFAARLHAYLHGIKKYEQAHVLGYVGDVDGSRTTLRNSANLPPALGNRTRVRLDRDPLGVARGISKAPKRRRLTYTERIELEAFLEGEHKWAAIQGNKTVRASDSRYEITGLFSMKKA